MIFFCHGLCDFILHLEDFVNDMKICAAAIAFKPIYINLPTEGLACLLSYFIWIITVTIVVVIVIVIVWWPNVVFIFDLNDCSE